MNQSSDRGWEALAAQDYGAACQHYRQALDAAVALEDKVAQTVFLGYLGTALKELGEYDQAAGTLSEALKAAEALDDARLIGHVSYLLAELALEESDESSAIALLWRSLDNALEADDADTAEVSLGLLGEIYRNRGWLEQAAECFRQAAELGLNQKNRIAWLGNLGQTLAEMGDSKGALPRFQEALSLADKEGDEKSKSNCIASEALVYFEEGNLDNAIACMQNALDLARRNKDIRAESCYLGNLGNLHLKLKQSDKAAELCGQALELARQAGDTRSEAAQLDSLGDCRMENGEYEEALKFYKNALDAAVKISDRLGERVYRANQARALRKLGRVDDAFVELRTAADLFEEQRSRIIQSDSLKTSFAGTGQQIYKDIISLCLESGKRVEAVEFVGRAKSRAMLDLLSNSPIDISDLQNIDDASISKLVEKEFELRSQITALERLFGQAEESGHRGGVPAVEDVPRLYRQWHDLIDQIRRRHPSYASMVSVDPLSYKDIAALWEGESKLLAGNQAIVEFFWSDGLFLSAALWQGLEQPVLQLISQDDLESLESDLYDFLEMSATEGWEVPLSLCRRLYDRLLASIVSSLPAGIEHLILVPHSILHKLPFAALHDGDKYIIQKYALSILPSSSLIKLLGSRRSQLDLSAGASYLISAISDYSATRDEGIKFSSRLRSSAGLEDLSYTIEEGKTVYGLASKLVPEAQFLSNQEVKDALLGRFRNYSVIHFAGHAVFNPEEPMASGLVLSDGSVLTAARILQDSSFRTSIGRLLILSACQTGVNVITSGGEIVGLARALFYAGMPNLISSLWEVADRSTAQLMQDFHRYWQAGKTSIAQALRQSQCRALSEGMPVHAWAPFIHLGID